MKVTATAGNHNIATVYLARMENGKWVEFVESVQPPIPRKEKWVLIVSTLYGCPVACPICDAGGRYEGILSTEEILAQVDYLVKKYFPVGSIPVKKFKIQFARMGEPTLNPHVLDVLEILPSVYDAPGLMPSLSTIAPRGTRRFFERLVDIKQQFYSGGNFQLQFSIHTTDTGQRDRWIPVKKWNFPEIADFAHRFYTAGDRKISLNFALARDSEVSPQTLRRYFNPDIFVIKLTPVNPTINAVKHGIVNAVPGDVPGDELPVVSLLRQEGYQVIVSIGEWEENKIGSNCGQYVRRYLQSKQPVPRESYQYQLKSIQEIQNGKKKELIRIQN
jgi:23S rRNA (adenine2503-C2)-methyltransferase